MILEGKIWEIVEGEPTTLFPFDINWLPAGWQTWLRIGRVAGSAESGWLLEAVTACGVVQLLNGDSLRVRPRLGEAALWRMQAVVNGIDKALNADREVSYSLKDGPTVDMRKALKGAFVRAIDRIRAESVEFGRTRANLTTNSAKGRILVQATARDIALKRAFPVHTVVSNRTWATKENRMLAAAASHLLSSTELEGRDKIILWEWIEEIGTAAISPDEVRDVSDEIARGAFRGSRWYYESALLIARIILGDAGAGISDKYRVKGAETLMYLPAIFEDYARTVLQRGFSEKGWVVAKNPPPIATLFLDGKMGLEPDIQVITERAKTLLDVKYKFYYEVSREDCFQMCSYLVGYNVPNGAIIRPTFADKPTVTQLRMVGGKNLFDIPINFRDPLKGEAELLAAVASVLGQ